MRSLTYYWYLFFVIIIFGGIKLNAAEYSQIFGTGGEKRYTTLSQVDSLANVVYTHVQNKDWLEVVRQSRELLTAPDSVLNAYPHTYFLYEWYVNGLNALGRYKDVVEITRGAQRYAESVFSPTEAAYYNMRVMRVVAYILMNRWDDARDTINEIEDIANRVGNGVVSHEVAALKNELYQAESTIDWRKDAQSQVDKLYRLADRLLLQSPASGKGREQWLKFFNLIQSQLELRYFDIDDPRDECYWSQLLACAIVCFNTFCGEMPGREEIAYDLTLLRKNFLDYHSGLLHKSPTRWRDVRDCLDSGELAVEITMCPDELLVVGKDFEMPIAITIPEELVNAIEAYDPGDAASISDFYSIDSPLTELIGLLGAHLDGIETIYISSSNLFAQFNYSAVPLADGRFDDRVNVVQMTTTADIAYTKQQSADVRYELADLYGGIDYDCADALHSDVADDSPSGIADAISATRSGFGSLPYSLQEVRNIKLHLVNASLFAGADATEGRLKQTVWNRMPRILHIATHGYTLPSEQNAGESNILSIRNRTGLLMAGANRSLKGRMSEGDDGILTSREIAEIDMGRVELAVLSSCSSGMGDLTNTTGVVYGVANAMKSSGVKRLVVTLWDIPDEASALAMEYFYAGIAKGLSPRMALKSMRNEMIKCGYANPYYWAAFVALE